MRVGRAEMVTAVSRPHQQGGGDLPGGHQQGGMETGRRMGHVYAGLACRPFFFVHVESVLFPHVPNVWTRWRSGLKNRSRIQRYLSIAPKARGK